MLMNPGSHQDRVGLHLNRSPSPTAAMQANRYCPQQPQKRGITKFKFKFCGFSVLKRPCRATHGATGRCRARIRHQFMLSFFLFPLPRVQHTQRPDSSAEIGVPVLPSGTDIFASCFAMHSIIRLSTPSSHEDDSPIITLLRAEPLGRTETFWQQTCVRGNMAARRMERPLVPSMTIKQSMGMARGLGVPNGM